MRKGKDKIRFGLAIFGGLHMDQPESMTGCALQHVCVAQACPWLIASALVTLGGRGAKTSISRRGRGGRVWEPSVLLQCFESCSAGHAVLSVAKSFPSGLLFRSALSIPRRGLLAGIPPWLPVPRAVCDVRAQGAQETEAPCSWLHRQHGSWGHEQHCGFVATKSLLISSVIPAQKNAPFGCSGLVRTQCASLCPGRCLWLVAVWPVVFRQGFFKP